MSGIAGVAGWPSPATAILAVEQMMAELERRGPDATGLVSLPEVVLVTAGWR